MDSLEKCLEFILEEEGGLANHRADPGGLTKYGISQRSYPNINIRDLTVARAKAIYRHDYWKPIIGDRLPTGLNLIMFDCAVNQGVGTAIKLLQASLRVKTDGVLGPGTMLAAERAMPELLDIFGSERALRYEFNRNEEVFGRGWYRRLLRVHRQAWQWANEVSA